MNDFAKEFCGHRLVKTTAITKRVQRRTHKKRRINKKWAKRYGYHDVPDTKKVVLVGGTIYAQPRLIDKIMEEIAKEKKV